MIPPFCIVIRDKHQLFCPHKHTAKGITVDRMHGPLLPPIPASASESHLLTAHVGDLHRPITTLTTRRSDGGLTGLRSSTYDGTRGMRSCRLNSRLRGFKGRPIPRPIHGNAVRHYRGLQRGIHLEYSDSDADRLPLCRAFILERGRPPA